MFIAHAPASYLLTTFILERTSSGTFSDNEKTMLLTGCIFAGIFPDFDLLYFFLVDNRQHNHHTYWTHLPLFWLTLTFLLSVINITLKARRSLIIILLLAANVFLHLVLDTMTSGIQWFQPFSGNFLSFIDISGGYQWWVWNFILHWTFIIELILTCAAIYHWRARRSGNCAAAGISLESQGKPARNTVLFR